jgi:hypothetical protein
VQVCASLQMQGRGAPIVCEHAAARAGEGVSMYPRVYSWARAQDCAPGRVPTGLVLSRVHRVSVCRAANIGNVVGSLIVAELESHSEGAVTALLCIANAAALAAIVGLLADGAWRTVGPAAAPVPSNVRTSLPQYCAHATQRVAARLPGGRFSHLLASNATTRSPSPPQSKQDRVLPQAGGLSEGDAGSCKDFPPDKKLNDAGVILPTQRPGE